MPYTPHLRINFGGFIGTLEGREEEWSCTLNMDRGGVAGVGIVVTDGMQSDVASDIQAWFTAVENKFCNNVGLTYMKLNQVGPNNRYIDPENPHTFDYPAPIQGPYATRYVPNQVSNVITLDTGKRATLSNGKTRPLTGRIYLPPQGFTIGADGAIAAAERDACLAAFQYLVLTLKNWPGIDDTERPDNVVVTTAAGRQEAVTAVRMGRVPDTQRRRRRSNLENYASLPI